MASLLLILVPLSLGTMCPMTAAFLTPSINVNNKIHLRRQLQPEQHRGSQIQLRSSFSPAISSNQELLPGIAAIDAGNSELFSTLERLRDIPYFRFFSVDILASCEYMPQELVECFTESCEIYPVDEDEIPEGIRYVDQKESDFDLDGWARWDMPSEDYYDTDLFPEGYTSYDGREVWTFIHERIAFQGYNYDNDHWKSDFNKAVSGLHAVIAAQVVRGIRERIETGEGFSPEERWTDPRAEFERRLGLNGEVPLAMENLYFLFMLLLTATARARDRLLMECNAGHMGDATQDIYSLFDSAMMKNILEMQGSSALEAASHKLRTHAVRDPESTGALWEARMRTRDLQRIMNCVQCNKCRLHGKISVHGVSTALQILLGENGEGTDPASIHRVGLATLVTTLHKCSRAIEFCREMRQG